MFLVVVTLATALASARPARVVLDPGHGGEAMGALGAYGVYEKHVTLAIARKLGRLLEADKDVTVFYTRKEDAAIDLKDRTAIANAVDADVFVSIHCNASPSPDAHGIETYYLGKGGQDPEADEVAGRENSGAEVAAQEEDPMLAALLGELRHDANLRGSAALAERIQRKLLARFPEAVSRAVRQARFAVLRKAGMPAVVVEVGFLTSKEEGMNLILEPYQDRLASALHDAIGEYLDGRAPDVGRRTSGVKRGH